MNSRIITIIALLFASNFAYSNNDNSSKFGILGGLNYTSVETEWPPMIKYKAQYQTSANFYLFFDYLLSENFILNSGIRYSVISTKLKDKTEYSIGIDKSDLDFNLKQILIPLRIKWQFDEFYPLAGLEVGYLLSPELKDVSRNRVADISYNKYDLLLCLGIGKTIRFERFEILSELVFNYSLTNVYNEKKYDPEEFKTYHKTLKTIELNINIGISFNL